MYGEKYEDTPNRVPDVTQAKDQLGFLAKISIDEGLKRTIDWYKKELLEGRDLS